MYVCMYVRAEKPGVPRRRGLLDCRSTEITVFRSVEQYGFLFRGCRSGVAERISGRYRAVQKTRIALGPGQKSMQQVSEPLQTPLWLAVAQGWLRGNEWETEGAPTQKEREIRRWCKKGSVYCFLPASLLVFIAYRWSPGSWIDTTRTDIRSFFSRIKRNPADRSNPMKIERNRSTPHRDGIFRSLYRSLIAIRFSISSDFPTLFLRSPRSSG